MKIKFIIKEELSKKEAASIMRICEENHYDNGGTLHFKALELPCKWTVLAKHDGKVVGYAVLYPEVLEKNDVYVMQVAIDKNYQHLGIGTMLYDYAYRHCKGYSFFTSNVNEQNFVSQAFHEKMGMRKFGIDEDGFMYKKEVGKDVKESFEDAKPEYFETKENEGENE